MTYHIAQAAPCAYVTVKCPHTCLMGHPPPAIHLARWRHHSGHPGKAERLANSPMPTVRHSNPPLHTSAAPPCSCSALAMVFPAIGPHRWVVGPPLLLAGIGAGGALPCQGQNHRPVWCTLADPSAPATKTAHVRGAKVFTCTCRWATMATTITLLSIISRFPMIVAMVEQSV